MKLTQEQLQVVYHPLGQHARVLAVAGSGKAQPWHIASSILSWKTK